MSAIVDNLIAYRVLSMLVTPFAETQAYKLGIIDVTGQNLIRSKDFTNSDQKQAYTYLHRLVFNLKKIINKLPGGESKLKNIVAAFFLIKESLNNKTAVISEDRVRYIVDLLDKGAVFVEEEMIVEDFLLAEEVGAANATGPLVSTDAPVIRRKRKFAKFDVNDEVYGKFAKGKAKFRRWNQYLNLENEDEKAIYNFARNNRDGIIILQNGGNVKSIRFNRRGGGSWSKLKRPVKQINNDVLD